MAFVRIEDLYGSVEAIVFPKILTGFSSILTEGNIVMAEGRISIREDDEPKLLLERAVRLDDLHIEEKPAQIPDKSKKTLYIRMEKADDAVIKMTVRVLEKHRGEMLVCFFINETRKKMYAPKDCWIDENSSIIADISAIFGENNVKIG